MRDILRSIQRASTYIPHTQLVYNAYSSNKLLVTKWNKQQSHGHSEYIWKS